MSLIDNRNRFKLCVYTSIQTTRNPFIPSPLTIFYKDQRLSDKTFHIQLSNSCVSMTLESDGEVSRPGLRLISSPFCSSIDLDYRVLGLES